MLLRHRIDGRGSIDVAVDFCVQCTGARIRVLSDHGGCGMQTRQDFSRRSGRLLMMICGCGAC